MMAGDRRSVLAFLPFLSIRVFFFSSPFFFSGNTAPFVMERQEVYEVCRGETLPSPP